MFGACHHVAEALFSDSSVVDPMEHIYESSIGFVGLGAMGRPMATNLLKKGFNVCLFDVAPGVAARFKSDFGGKLCKSLREVGAATSVVVTMLPTSKIVRSAFFDQGGLLEGLRRDAIVIDMSSGVPSETVRLAADLRRHGVTLIDAPVSGGTRRAINGELAIMVGGEGKVIEQVSPVLLAMGRSITRMGSVGAGQAMKALNNLAQAGSFLIALEALLVGKKFGLDPAVIVDVLNASSGMNYNTQTKFKDFVLSGTYAAGFSMDLLVKDIGIAVELAGELDASVPFSTECHAQWSAAAAALGVGHDHTEIAKVAAEVIGVAFP